MALLPLPYCGAVAAGNQGRGSVRGRAGDIGLGLSWGGDEGEG